MKLPASVVTPFLQLVIPSVMFLAVTTSVSFASTESVIHNFKGGQDGQAPYSPLVADKNGNLYGTTTGGGKPGAGVAFELTPGPAGWIESVLYSFQGGSDGSNPGNAGLVLDSAGNLYGVTSSGGAGDCDPGCGTVFELSPPPVLGGPWTKTILYSFKGQEYT